MSCCTRANLLILIPNTENIKISATSPTGWYVLYSPTNPSYPEPIYHKTGSSKYLDWSTTPVSRCNDPIIKELSTGLCQLWYADVEDDKNSYQKASEGFARDESIYTLNGFIKEPYDTPLPYTSQQFYGFLKTYGPFDTENPIDLQYTMKGTLTNRPVPSDMLIPSCTFGVPLNLIFRDFNSYSLANTIVDAPTVSGIFAPIRRDPQTRVAHFLYTPPITGTDRLPIPAGFLGTITPLVAGQGSITVDGQYWIINAASPVEFIIEYYNDMTPAVIPTQGYIPD